MPVIIGNKVAGVVYLSRTPNAVVSILGATLLIGLIFLRTVSRPIYGLMDRTTRIAAVIAMRSVRSAATARGRWLNYPGALLDMAQKLQARSDTIRTFAAHVSHELKSPLKAIRGAAELLRDGRTKWTALSGSASR
jgi:signal transduction histidine kinase